MAWRKEILFFAISGVLGFVVDAGIVQFLVREWPAIGVAAGSIAGAVVNFLTSKYWIFRVPRSASRPS